MRVNAFMAYNAIDSKEERLEHKHFVMALVDSLLERARVLDYGRTRSVHEKRPATEDTNKRGLKLPRLSHRRPTFPQKRFEGLPSEHVMTKAPKRSVCKYCSYLRLIHKARKETTEPPKVSNVYRMCSKCGVHLCTAHFECYHAVSDNTSDDNETEGSM